MIVVDTSIWIEFFRGRNSIVDNHLRKLIDQDQVFLAAPVRLEILMGAARKEVSTLRRVLSALPLLVPGDATWQKLESWVDGARKAGERFGAMDLLIAGIADDHGASVWSMDEDFARMARLNFAKLFQA